MVDLNTNANLSKFNDVDFDRLVTFVKTKYGLDLSKKKILIQSRLTSVIKERKLSSFSEYIDIVLKDRSGRELEPLLNKLTTNHSFFMREPEHFDFLTKTILPDLIKKHAATKTITIWSAGCSAGQEVYTTAMVIDNFLGPNASSWKINFQATDISADVLGKAKNAVYTADNLKDIPESWKTKYFVKSGNDYQVCDALKRQVTFGTLNLMENFHFAKPYDLVMCRNVMIYFDKPTKDALVNRFYSVTANGGYLFIGHSEVIDKDLTKFNYVKPAIYQKKV